MTQAVQLLAKCGEALRNRREQLALSCAAKHNDKDTSEHNVGNTLIDLEGCDNLWWDAFAAPTIAICNIGHGVQECPYEQESGKDANACCRQNPDGVITAAQVVQVGDVCSFDEEKLCCETADEEEGDAEVDCCPTETSRLYTNARDCDRRNEEGDGHEIA